MDIDKLTSELKQIKEEKYNLLKLINHDIRSPFNRIFALLQLFELENTAITDRQKEYIDSIYLSILSGLEMISNLRDMREIDANYIEIDITTFDLVDTIKKAIRSFSKQIEVKKLNIREELSIDNAPISSDAFFVQRVVENVLSNAIKFSKNGSEIYVRLNRDKNAYTIEIQDFGDGIPAEELPMLYKKFKKLSSVTTGGEGSLGLGLHNTAYFLRRLNGEISLKKSDASGTVFIIRFPV